MCRGNRYAAESSANPQISSLASTQAGSSLGMLHPLNIGEPAQTFENDTGPRRKSVDIGGLALALGKFTLGEEDSGKGWQSGNAKDGALYAELLSDMYTQTQSAASVPISSQPPVVSNETRCRLISALDEWHFEPHKLPDEEVLACTQLLFEALYRIEGMQELTGVSIPQIGQFLVHLRQAYRASNSYHNFQHALDVFQATHMYLREAGAVPPVSILHSNSSWRSDNARVSPLIRVLRKEDIFALYIAAVGHDVGHPGFNNMFMKNAQAPLSQVYDHKSALERMHCAFLLPIMKRHGFAHLLERGPAGSQFRKLLLDTVLATDMGVHAQFMQRFQQLIEDPRAFDVMEVRIIVCQALIKCADISNPSRPHNVSQHWSAALASEWASQALLEKQLRLPVTVSDSADPKTEAKIQISFITLFCQPLLNVTSTAIPEMKGFSEQCATNCALWKERLADFETQTQPNYPPVPYRAVSPMQPQDFLSVFPLSLPVSFISPIARNERYPSSPSTSLMVTDPISDLTVAAVSGAIDADENPAPSSSSPFAVGGTGSDSTTGRGINEGSLVLSERPRPAISTQGIQGQSPSGNSPSDSSSSGSPRSDYALRTPGGFAASSSNLNTSPGAGGSNTSGGGGGDPSIRAAYASLQSIRKKKSLNRNSWTWTPSPLSTRTPYSPEPVPDLPRMRVQDSNFTGAEDVTMSPPSNSPT